jgi:hypothetical protein
LIESNNIKNVIFVTADLHYAAVSRIPGKLKLKEITAGPIGSPMNIITSGFERRFEFFSNQTFNFAMVTVDPKSSKPHALVELVDEEGKNLYKTRLEAV